MPPRRLFPLVASAVLLATAFVVATAQRPGAFGESIKHPAIAYLTAPVKTAVTELEERVESDGASLPFDAQNGYLAAVLAALKVPVESQVLVYAETSQQASKINQQNPRAIYFNDSVAVAWVRGGDVLEVAAQDPRQGTIYYTLAQSPTGPPRFARDSQCLRCHLSWDTLAVPGPMVLTVLPRKSDRDYADGGPVDHRTPIDERWGGWFVTGAAVPARHKANVPLLQPTPRQGPPPRLTSIEGQFDPAGYLSMHSDVVALMVLEHQAHATNLIIRAGWESRVGNAAGVREAVDDLVDYLLFVDEAPIPGRVRGSSSFAETFAAQGPRDSKGRSLRDLKLEGRLMQYPLSYMIYAPAFDALSTDVLSMVAERLGAVLTGRDARPRYAHLTAELRSAVREILTQTRPALLAGTLPEH